MVGLTGGPAGVWSRGCLAGAMAVAGPPAGGGTVEVVTPPGATVAVSYVFVITPGKRLN